MKPIHIEMPLVRKCEVLECTYNTGSACHAKAITVGANVHPDCGTYFSAGASHSRATDITAGVGACKMSDCSYNDDYECVAQEIMVGFRMDKPNCMTYTHRSA